MLLVVFDGVLKNKVVFIEYFCCFYNEMQLFIKDDDIVVYVLYEFKDVWCLKWVKWVFEQYGIDFIVFENDVLVDDKMFVVVYMLVVLLNQ